MDFWLVSSDGTRLSADHTAPRSAADAGRVGVVLVPGFASSWRQERVRRVAEVLAERAGVLSVDMRGHGLSGGHTTLGRLEPADAQAAVLWMRQHYERVALVGFSMGAAVVLRTAALFGSADAVVAVSGPAFWYYRGTRVMRRLHRAVYWAPGRGAIRVAMRTRVSAERWPDALPMSPVEAAEALAPAPLLIVHGDDDVFFPLDHPRALLLAGQRGADVNGGLAEAWIERGFGHAEGAIEPALTRRVAAWIDQAVATGAASKTGVVRRAHHRTGTSALAAGL